MKILPPPGPERRRQLVRLGVLVGVLAIALWFRGNPAEPPALTSNLPAAAPAVAPMTLPEPVRLTALDEAAPPTDVGRNPFGFGARPAPEAREVYTPPPAVRLPPPAPPMPQGPPPIQLRLAGLMVDPGTGRTMATLKDPASGSLFHAFEGHVVDGRYRIVKVGMQSVVVSYVDGSGQRTLGLGN